MKYSQFLETKSQHYKDGGFEPGFIPDYLFDFQKSLLSWSLKKGRAAIFADCGMGKTVIELVWARNIINKTKKPVLILAPLAVSFQTEKEGGKFNIKCKQSKEGEIKSDIVITNYEQLHYFDPKKFGGVVCDESSILKNYDGKRRNEITEFMKKISYRLLATATAAPNDYIELGTSSEALGYLGHVDMLNRFFVNDRDNIATKRMYGQAPKWRFKGHAEQPFWRWVASWARACRMPSDLGFDDDGFILPDLIEKKHIVKNIKPLNGKLFNFPAFTLDEQREEIKRTIPERCQKVADLVNYTDSPALVWCHRNEEGVLLNKLIPDSVEIKGSDSDDFKVKSFLAFLNQEKRVLITKPKIGAWGLNFQHCNHIVYFPSHSYESYYQAIRRCWRFGQKKNVTVDIILTEGQQRIMENLEKKSIQASKMFENLVKEMNDVINLEKQNKHIKNMEVPTWL